MYFKNKTHIKSTPPEKKTRNNSIVLQSKQTPGGGFPKQEPRSPHPACRTEMVTFLPFNRAPLRALCPCSGVSWSLPSPQLWGCTAVPSWPTQAWTWCGFQPGSKESYRAALKRRRGGEKSVRNCRKGRENICPETGGGNKASFLQVCNASIKVFKHSHTE